MGENLQKKRWYDEKLVQTYEMMYSVIVSEKGDYRDYFINLRDAIWGKAEIAVTAEEGANVMKIIELAIQSDKERRTIDVTQ